MKKHPIYIALLVAVMFAFLNAGQLKAAEPDSSKNLPSVTKLALNYLCGPQDTINLSATLLVMRGEYTYALKNVEIEFFVTGEGAAKSMGKVTTDQEGIAKISFTDNGLPADKEGMISYLAKFAGTGKYPAAEASVSAKPAIIKLFFSIEDSVKILKVTATQKNQKGEIVPIAGATVPVYVPRLFSLLKIGEITLDAQGTGTLDFPKEIVGDTLGNLTVLAKIEEHDVFGYVQGKNTINWGVPKQYYKAEVPSRELWTPIAPLWMVITLIIMLLGVWAHYIYAVYELVMIKKLSKKDPLKF